MGNFKVDLPNGEFQCGLCSDYLEMMAALPKADRTRGIKKRNHGQTYGPYVSFAVPFLPNQQRVSLVQGAEYKFSGLGITPPLPPFDTRDSGLNRPAWVGGNLITDVIIGTFRGIETINGVSSYLVEGPTPATMWRLLTSLVTKIVYIRG